MTDTAQIITSYGRRYIVRTPDGKTYEASTRKKRVDFACGDRVHIQTVNAEQAVIEDYLPRESLLYRQDAWKTKLIAANVTQLLIVTAAVPSPSEALLQRALLAAEAAGIQAVIILNKADLPETALWREKLKFYETLGYPVIETRALENTHAQLYDLNEETQLIDSPGLQEFGLHHLEAADLLQYFPDLSHLVGQCRFHNCTHRAEPGCAVKAAAQTGKIRTERLTFLQRITDDLLK